MSSFYDSKRIKQNLRDAIKDGSIWQDEDKNIVTSVFQLALGLQASGVNCRMAVQTPAVNEVTVIDRDDLQRFLAEEKLPEIQQKNGQVKFLM